MEIGSAALPLCAKISTPNTEKEEGQKPLHPPTETPLVMSYRCQQAGRGPRPTPPLNPRGRRSGAASQRAAGKHFNNHLYFIWSINAERPSPLAVPAHVTGDAGVRSGCVRVPPSVSSPSLGLNRWHQTVTKCIWQGRALKLRLPQRHTPPHPPYSLHFLHTTR